MKKTVLITGASSGIGKACAYIFAKNEYDVIITGRRAERLEEVKKEIESTYSCKVITLSFDIQNKTATFEAIEKLQQQKDSIDVLINNAGLALGKAAFDEGDIEDWDTMIQTNVNGLLYISKAALPLLKGSEAPHIINIGSTAGKEVYENGNIYCATKFAVDAITKAMRMDLLKHRIKVTAVNPGAAETEFSLVRFKGDGQKADESYSGYVPLTAGDIANTIYYCTTLPREVCINDLTITSLSQANSYYINKSK